MTTPPELDVIGQALTLAENAFLYRYGEGESPYVEAFTALQALRRERETTVRVKKSDVPEYLELEYDLTDMEADVHFEKQAKDWSIYNAARVLYEAMGGGE